MLKYKISHILAYLLYNAILLTISFFLGRFFQMLIFLLFYDFIQNCFNYRFHADTVQNNPIKAVRLCKVITIAVEIIYLILCKRLDISVYSNLLIIFSIAFLNSILQFSLEYFLIKADSLHNKDKLLALCQKANLTQNATDRMIMKYIENLSYQEIADKECVDIDTIKKSINRSRKKIFKNQD